MCVRRVPRDSFHDQGSRATRRRQPTNDLESGRHAHVARRLAGGSTTAAPGRPITRPIAIGSLDTLARGPILCGTASEKHRSVREDSAIRNPCYWYTEYEDGQRELYELHSDPFQLTQLLPNAVTGYPDKPGGTIRAILRSSASRPAWRRSTPRGAETVWPMSSYTDRRSVWLRPTPTERREALQVNRVAANRSLREAPPGGTPDCIHWCVRLSAHALDPCSSRRTSRARWLGVDHGVRAAQATRLAARLRRHCVRTAATTSTSICSRSATGSACSSCR